MLVFHSRMVPDVLYYSYQGQAAPDFYRKTFRFEFVGLA